jgi:germination protein M
MNRFYGDSFWRARRSWLAVALLVAALALAAACADRDDDNGGATPTPGDSATPTPAPGTSPTPSPTPATGDQVELSVFFLRGEAVAPVYRALPQTQAVGRAAMEELLRGPNQTDRGFGLTSEVPQGTRLLGLDIANRVATVNLSREYETGGGSLSMQARLAQVVYTLTQFPTVESVIFQIEGTRVTAFGGEGIVLDRPVGRADFENVTPILLVLTPRTGETVSSPVRLTGTANAFEATFQVEVVDPSGRIVAEQTVTATSGTGTRGTFDVTVPFTIQREGFGAIIVFELSAKDGSRTNIEEIPVQMTQ